MGKCKGLQKKSGAAKEEGNGANQQQSKQQQQPQKKARPQVIHGDLYQRATFTFQASAFLQQLQSQPVPETKCPATSQEILEDGNDRPTKKEACDFARLSRNIMAANRKMVIHNQMKLDPSMKRNICETCSTVLIPGLTSRVRNRPSRTHFNVTHTSCFSCDTRRTVPCPPTSVGEEGLDGTKRAARRRKQAKRAKVPFHNRESITTTGTQSQLSQKGHTLWRGDKTVDGWGEIASSAAAPTETIEN